MPRWTDYYSAWVSRSEEDRELRNTRPRFSGVLAGVFLAGLLSTVVPAQGEAGADKTGTNPINFTYDARIYNEFIWLNADGDGENNVTTVEFRAPLLDGKYQFRVKARYSSIEADFNDDGIDEVDESGFGDVDVRILTVPYLDMSKKLAFAVGWETFFDTASEDVLGSGTLSFGPQAFLVFFEPFGMKGALFAPAYQHKFSVDEDDGRDEVHQGLIDLFLVMSSPSKQHWAIVNPQIVLDYENSAEFALIDVEMGTMIGTQGHSVYVRPSIGIGTDRPTDGSIEAGCKVVW